MMMVVLVVIGETAHHISIARSTAKDIRARRHRIPGKKHIRAPRQYRSVTKAGFQSRSIVLRSQNRHGIITRNRRSTGRRPKILIGCQESGFTCRMGIDRHGKGLATRRRRVIRQGIRGRSQIHRTPVQRMSGGHQVTCEGARTRNGCRRSRRPKVKIGDHQIRGGHHRHGIFARTRRRTGRRPKMIFSCLRSGVGGQINGNPKQVMTDSHARGFGTRRGRMIGQGVVERPEVKECALTRNCRETSRRPNFFISGGKSNGRIGVLSVLTGATGIKIGPKIVRGRPNIILCGSQPAQILANRSCPN